MKRENEFQSKLIKRLKEIFPGCMVIKLDPNYLQGLPDLVILYGGRWAALECKRSVSAARQPNQEHYIYILDCMSFARFIYPENEEEVLNELQQALGTRR